MESYGIKFMMSTYCKLNLLYRLLFTDNVSFSITATKYLSTHCGILAEMSLGLSQRSAVNNAQTHYSSKDNNLVQSQTMIVDVH